MASVLFHYAPPVTALPDWQLFLICAAASAVLEYATSYFLEKKFHARWWDYRDMPLNLNGRICLPATVGFGLAGLVIIRVILPKAGSYETALPPLAAEALALAITALISADTAITCVALTSLLERLEHFDEEFNKTAESAYARVHSVTVRQANILMNIRRINSEKANAAADKMRNAVRVIKHK